MKLYTIAWQNRPLVCLENRPGRLTPLPYETMNHLLADRPDHRAGVLEKAGKGSGEFALAEVQVLAPIPHPRQDVICLGMNYQKHKTEAERFDAAAFTREKAQAVYFSKRATHCPGPGAPIPGHFDLVDSLDYETELAVILGRDAKNVTEAEAFDYVFGYTIVNDVSARNLQTGHKQWYFGKGLDGFTPMGPCIVTKEAFPQPPAQAIRTWGWALIRPGSCGRGMWSAVRLRALVFWKTLWKDNRNQTASGLAPLAVSLVSQETLLPQGRGTNPGPAGRPVSAPVGSVSPPSPSGGR